MIKNKQIKKFIDIIESFDFDVYLVGGAVRDILLGLDPIDYDFVAVLKKEKHLYISNQISTILNCELIYNNYYNTAKFLYDGMDIDFVMARKELYDGIASKPKIMEGTLIDDLKRRDYTINSIAYDIKNDKYIDYLGGLEDLKNKKIVILHDKSFRDDPTRFFRGIKYASRLNFEIDDNTFDLMKQCIDKGYINYLPKSRVKSEIDAMIIEDNSIKSIETLDKLNFFKKYVGEKIKINIPIDTHYKYLDTNDRYIAFFYKNDIETLKKIKLFFEMPNYFIEKCLKLNKLNDMLKFDDYLVYDFLLTSFKNIEEKLLRCCFCDYRIENYIKNKDFKVDKSKIEEIPPDKRKEYLIQQKIKYLIDLGGKNG